MEWERLDILDDRSRIIISSSAGKSSDHVTFVTQSSIHRNIIKQRFDDRSVSRWIYFRFQIASRRLGVLSHGNRAQLRRKSQDLVKMVFYDHREGQREKLGTIWWFCVSRSFLSNTITSFSRSIRRWWRSFYYLFDHRLFSSLLLFLFKLNEIFVCCVLETRFMRGQMWGECARDSIMMVMMKEKKNRIHFFFVFFGFFLTINQKTSQEPEKKR